ncbi:MAG: hypothetical protein R6X02_25250 [Enhygromyxa sp.]
MLSLGPARALIDQSYAEFVAEVPEELRAAARELPHLLGLSSRAELSWSDADIEPVVLSLPTLLLTRRRRPIAAKLRESAQRAHLFALISALIQAGLDEGSLTIDARMDGLLLAVERQRHRALAELRLLGADRNSSFMTAERETRGAAATEREIFAGRSEAELPSYVAICCAKQSLAFPATMAAAVASGAEVDELAHVHDVILGVTLGVAARSEVIGRSERERAGRSWVAALSRTRERSEAVGELLGVASEAFEHAAAAAEALGSDELAHWARQQIEHIRVLMLRERERASAA